MSTTSTERDPKAVAVRCFELMRAGSLPEFEELVHPDALNREAEEEPPASRGRGPAAFYATAIWLRDAFGDLRWEIHHAIAEGDLVAVHCTMTGRHVGTFVLYDHEARVAQAYPPTGREFAVTQSHWVRVADGKLIEHWANRDDLGQGFQLGWFPPTPEYMAQAAEATERAKRGQS